MKNYNKLMKTLSCTANKGSEERGVLQWRMTFHCHSHDTLKSGSKIQTLLDCYVFDPNLFNWHSNVWHLTDLLEYHNLYKQIETTGR